MKRGPFLVDTGFVVALINELDPAHDVCAHAWQQVQGPFLSTEGMLVELAGLLRKSQAAFPAAMKLLQGVGCQLVPPTAWRYQRATELMATYADVPMDFVEALLVAISEDTGVLAVLTLDRRGFSTYRSKGKAFRITP